MAAQVKTYFLAPTFDVPPEQGIVLGNIIANARQPEERVNSTILPVPTADLVKSTKTNYRSGDERTADNTIGVFTQFLAVVGAGVDANVRRATTDNLTLTIDTLETQYFNPTHEYIDKAARAPEVLSYLSRKNLVRRRKPLYMVTGIKIARRAAANSLKKRENEVKAEVSVNLAAVTGGMPLTVGPKVDHSQGRTSSVGWDESTDFVYAYRLRKIRLREDGAVDDKPHYDGASLGVSGPLKEATKAGTGSGEPVAGLRFEDEEISTEDFDVDVASVLDDGSSQTCLLAGWREDD